MVDAKVVFVMLPAYNGTYPTYLKTNHKVFYGIIRLSRHEPPMNIFASRLFMKFIIEFYSMSPLLC
jgi:hypothetical protein